MADSRSIDVSVEVPGPPDQVWDTIATGPGISSWFIPSQVDGRAGGEVVMDFGPGYGVDTVMITAWEPPHRLLLAGGPEHPLVNEWTIEPGDGGTCVVRLVVTGFGVGEDADAEVDGLRHGWPL